jgi:hypothetical protein
MLSKNRKVNIQTEHEFILKKQLAGETAKTSVKEYS